MLAAELRSGDQVVVGRKSWLSLNAPWVISTGISVSFFITSLVLR